MALLQRLDQEQDFGGRREVQIRGVGEGEVAAAGDNGLEGTDEGARVAWQIGIGGNLMEARRRGSRVASKQGLRYSEGEATFGIVILAAIATVGEVASDGLSFR